MTEYKCAQVTTGVPTALFVVNSWDTMQLESEDMGRIMALCSRACQAEGSAGEMGGLMEEVNVDYLRTMNKIVLEAQTKEVRTRSMLWVADRHMQRLPRFL